MMYFEGSFEVCDRCHKTFLILFYELYEKQYEQLKNSGYVVPEGIEFEFQDACIETTVGELCPDCYEEYQKMQKSFMEDFKHERHTE